MALDSFDCARLYELGIITKDEVRRILGVDPTPPNVAVDIDIKTLTDDVARELAQRVRRGERGGVV